MPSETIDKLSISLGFMEAQAVGTFAIGAMVFIVVCILCWMAVVRLGSSERRVRPSDDALQ